MNNKPLDLNLDNLKAGDEITSVKVEKDGSLSYGAVRIILELSGCGDRWRYTNRINLNKVAGSFPLNGVGYYAMSKRITPHFFYSANPKHIEESKKNRARVIAAAELRKAEQLKNLESFEKELDALLKKYGADIYATQLSGDDQGVELDICISVGDSSKTLTEG